MKKDEKNKVRKASEIASEINSQEIVMTNGCFDLLHLGHMQFLKECARQGKVLCVGLNTDESTFNLKGPSRPILTFEIRALTLAHLDYVDYIFPIGERCVEEILELRPKKYCKAGDYDINTLDKSEKAALIEVGAEISFIPHTYEISTSKIVAKILAKNVSLIKENAKNI